MVNKVILIGNLAAEPDVKATPKGTYVANMRLATHTYVGKDEEGKAKEETEFHRLVAFGKLAEFAGQYLAKGRLVFAAGRLTYRSWEGKNGQTHHATEVVARELTVLDRRPDAAPGEASSEGDADDDVPV